MKRFRLQSKNLFLTYSNVEVELEKELILLSLRRKLGNIVFYMIAEEKHESGKNHYHVVVVLKKRIDIKSEKRLDLKLSELVGEGGIDKSIHGSYERCRDVQYAITYCLKEDKKPLYNFKLDENGLLMGFEEIIIDYAKKGMLKEAFSELERVNPGILISRDHVIEASLKNIKKRHEKKLELGDLSREFNFPMELENFIEEKEYERKSLMLSGKSGTGKTQAAKYILINICNIEEKKVLFTNQLEGLRELESGDYKGVILDDVDLMNIIGEDFIGLVDIENSREINARYSNIKINSKILRIITTNKSLEEFVERNKNITEEQKNAIRRRVVEIEVKENLYKSINLNINVKLK